MQRIHSHLSPERARASARAHERVCVCGNFEDLVPYKCTYVPALVLVPTLSVTLGTPERYTESNYRRGCEIDFRLAINRRRKPVAVDGNVCSRFFNGYVKTSGGGKSS